MSASIQRLTPEDFRVMPWKNGGGQTTELIIEPPGATLESGFHWRLSMADVGLSGPFSRFEGCDRTLLLLEGRGIQVDFGEHGTRRLDRLLDPVCFSGDWDTIGTLLVGPVRDFNVITQRAVCRHTLEILHVGAAPEPLPPADPRFVFCLEGRARIEPLGEVISARELLRLEGQHDLQALAEEGTGAVLISVGILR